MDFLHPGLLDALEAGFTVLAPNRRAAQALRQAFGEQRLAEGHRAWETPDVLTVGAWTEQLWYDLRPSSHRLLSSRQGLVLWERIVADSPSAEFLLNPASAAKAAARSWDLAQAHGIPLAAISAEGGEEAGTLVAWATRFERDCQANGWLPTSRIPHELARSTTLPALKVQLALGRDPTPAEAGLFGKLAAAGGMVRGELPSMAPGNAMSFPSADPEQELLDAARWARMRLDEGCRSIAIVVPSLATRRHDVRRVLEDAFIPAGRRSGEAARRVPFTVEASGVLTEFPLVRTALDLLELSTGEADGLVAGRLLRSPFLDGGMQEAPARAIAEVRLRSDRVERMDVPALERLAGASRCPILATRLAGMREWLPRARESATASEWAERFLALWKAAGWPGKDRSPDSHELQTLAKLNEALGGFGSLDDFTGSMSFGEACARFRQWATATSYEPRTLPAPITVLDAESIGGQRFDALWIMGCDATRMPPPPEPDPFLPLRLQRQAGMPEASATGTRQQCERAFSAIKGSAGQLVCSWARRQDDAEQSPSPLLAGLGQWVDPPVIRPTLAGWLQQHAPDLERIDDRLAPAVPPGIAKGGARIVELQSACAFRAQAELRLGARPLEQVAPGIDVRERGTLLHKALELLWAEFRDQHGLLAIPEEKLRDRVFQTLDRLSVPFLKGASAHRERLLRIEVDIATRKVCELLAVERQRPPFRVLERPEYAETVSAAGLTIDLKIDRIDLVEPGSEVVIDYKTGRSSQPSKWWGDRPEQPQLPLYAVARRARLEAVAFALLNAKDSGFSGVARQDGVLPGVRAVKGEWSAVLDDWQRTVEQLIGAYARGEATVDPLPQACNRCHLASLCRIHEMESSRGLDAEEGP